MMEGLASQISHRAVHHKVSSLTPVPLVMTGQVSGSLQHRPELGVQPGSLAAIGSQERETHAGRHLDILESWQDRKSQSCPEMKFASLITFTDKKL